MVPDTNIIISALFWEGPPHHIIQRGLLGEFELVTSAEIIGEVSEKLGAKFNYPPEEAARVVDVMLSLFRVVEASSVFPGVRDPKDGKILACAVDGNADYVVTGDSDLLVLKSVRSVRIVSASDFLRAYPSRPVDLQAIIPHAK